MKKWKLGLKINWRIAFFCAVCSVVSALVCLMVVFNAVGGVGRIPALMKYAEALWLIESRYIGEYDEGGLGDAAVGAAVASLGDRWSWYMSAEDYGQYKLREGNQYPGIGITIEPVSEADGGGMRIVDVRKNTPAANAGIEPGMIMLEVAGEDVRTLDAAGVRDIMMRQEGREFEIRLRGADGNELTVSVRSETIYTPPVEWELLESGVGYISIANFESGAGDGVGQALAELTEAGARGIVFDVRNNPGGKVSELTSCLDAMLPKCVVFVAVDSNGKITETLADAEFVDLPAAVLVNENSYSAAEYFAAALEEHGAARSVGSPTSGKSRSQLTFVLSDGSAVHISTAGYLTPNRVDLQEAGGLRPRIDVPMTEEERALLAAGLLEPGNDPQLRAAVAEIT